jgi:hypothetical protein
MGFDYERYDLRDYYDYVTYFNDLIENRDKLVAHNWSSKKQFGQIVLIKT